MIEAECPTIEDRVKISGPCGKTTPSKWTGHAIWPYSNMKGKKIFESVRTILHWFLIFQHSTLDYAWSRESNQKSILARNPSKSPKQCSACPDHLAIDSADGPRTGKNAESACTYYKNVRPASLVCSWASSCSLGIFLLLAACSTKRKVLASRPMSSSKMTFYPSGWPWPSVVCFTNILSLRGYRCALPHCHCLRPLHHLSRHGQNKKCRNPFLWGQYQAQYKNKNNCFDGI